jgi:hypothetical protein
VDSTKGYVPYRLIREIIKRNNGSMEFQAGGGPGGVWIIKLEGRKWTVAVRDRRANELDHLYVPKTDHPQTWEDYEKTAPLKPDAFWQLMKLIDSQGIPSD